MKKTVYIILFVILNIVTKAQIKPIFLDTTKMWVNLERIDTSANFSIPRIPYSMKTTFQKFTTDTIILGKNYKKVLESTDSGNTWQCKKYIREDSIKNVYFINKNNTKEQLLYQFGLKLNDTVSVIDTIQFQNKWTFVISNIDSILLSGKYRKRFTISNTITNLNSYVISSIWIEDLGSLSGLFYPFVFCEMDCKYNNYLLCYFENNNIVYHIPYYTNCYYNTKTAFRIEVLIKNSIYPNPVTTILTIKLENYLNKSTIVILNNLGQKLKEQKFEGIETMIDVTTFKSGLYYFQLIKEGKLLSVGKFIKQ